MDFLNSRAASGSSFFPSYVCCFLQLYFPSNRTKKVYTFWYLDLCARLGNYDTISKVRKPAGLFY